MEGLAVETTLPPDGIAPRVSRGHFMMAKMPDGRHTPSSLVGTQQDFVHLTVWDQVFSCLPQLVKFLGFGLLLSLLASLNLHSEQGRAAGDSRRQ